MHHDKSQNTGFKKQVTEEEENKHQKQYNNKQKQLVKAKLKFIQSYLAKN